MGGLRGAMQAARAPRSRARCRASPACVQCLRSSLVASLWEAATVRALHLPECMTSCCAAAACSLMTLHAISSCKAAVAHMLRIFAGILACLRCLHSGPRKSYAFACWLQCRCSQLLHATWLTCCPCCCLLRADTVAAYQSGQLKELLAAVNLSI